MNLLILISLIVGTLRTSIPLIIGAVGEIFNERVGIINIGIEGIMLFGAFMAVYGAWAFQNPLIGVLLALFTGMIWGFLFGAISTHLRGDQIIAGMGINVFAMGFTEMMIPLIWGTYGYSETVKRLPPLFQYGGERISYFLAFTIALVVFSHTFLYKTKWGLHLRSCGENPLAADAAGINVYKIRYLTSIFSSALFSLAGAYMSVDWNDAFVKEMTGGRGFIALALVIFANWRPFLALIGGLLFGFFDALQFRIGAALGVGVPPQIPQMIPYLATILFLLLLGKVKGPTAAGKPFVKE